MGLRGRKGVEPREMKPRRKGVGKILRDLINPEKGKKYVEEKEKDKKREGPQRRSEKNREGE